MRGIKEQLGLEKIAELLRSSEEVQVNSEGDKVKRAKELVPQKDQFERSIYAKGFPEETETLQEEMEKFFAQFGKIASVRMRRDQSVKGKKAPFKGSVFVEFVEFDEMNAFLAKSNSENVEERPKFTKEQLKVMTKEDYCNMKMVEKGIDPKTVQRGVAGGSGGKSSGPGNKNIRFNAFKELEREARGLPSAFNETKETEKKSKAEEAEDRRKRAHENRSKPYEFDFNDAKVTTNPDGTIVESTLKFPERSVLAFKGAGEGGNWKDLKETLISIHPTSFVEFPQGAIEGAVGFKTTLEDGKMAEIVSRAITVGGKAVEWSRVDEDRARKFYLDRANFRAKHLIDQREEREAEGGSHFSGGRGGGRGGRGRGGGRGGRGGHRSQRGNGDFKRKRDDGDGPKSSAQDAPPQIGSAKKPKTEV